MSLLRREDGTALWAQVKIEVRDNLLVGLRPGDLIPTENELCEKYGVSRSVVRQAISSLVNEGRLSRHQGRGTFVAAGKLEHNLAGSFSFSRRISQAKLSLDTRLLIAVERHPSELVRGHLGLTDRDVVYRIRRLRMCGDEPIAYQADELPVGLCPGLISEDANLVSIGNTLAKKYGLVPASVSISAECIMADDERAEHLQIPRGTPLIVIERVFYLRSGQPVRYSRTRYRHDRFKLVISALPVGGSDSFEVEDE